MTSICVCGTGTPDAVVGFLSSGSVKLGREKLGNDGLGILWGNRLGKEGLGILMGNSVGIEGLLTYTLGKKLVEREGSDPTVMGSPAATTGARAGIAGLGMAGIKGFDIVGYAREDLSIDGLSLSARGGVPGPKPKRLQLQFGWVEIVAVGRVDTAGFVRVGFEDFRVIRGTLKNGFVCRIVKLCRFGKNTSLLTYLYIIITQNFKIL